MDTSSVESQKRVIAVKRLLVLNGTSLNCNQAITPFWFSTDDIVIVNVSVLTWDTDEVDGSYTLVVRVGVDRGVGHEVAQPDRGQRDEDEIEALEEVPAALEHAEDGGGDEEEEDQDEDEEHEEVRAADDQGRRPSIWRRRRKRGKNENGMHLTESCFFFDPVSKSVLERKYIFYACFPGNWT